MAHEKNEKGTDSVFDFLYVDHRRVGLYQSQFSDFGNLTNLVHSQQVSRTSSARGGIPSVVHVEGEKGTQSGIEKHFDAQWSEVLNFLDEIQARQMIRRKLSTASIGSLMLASGSLQLVSMRPFERTFDAISGSTESQGNRRERRFAAKRRQTEVADEDEVSGLKILASLEQPVFMVLKTEQGRLWSTLDPNFLVGGSADLNLKHGLQMAGTWHVLGIMDCEPGSGQANPEELGRLCGGADNNFSESVVDMWHEFRLVFGRPIDCYGITPLVVMREIA